MNSGRYRAFLEDIQDIKMIEAPSIGIEVVPDLQCLKHPCRAC
jgi:hypothetical protein